MQSSGQSLRSSQSRHASSKCISQWRGGDSPFHLVLSHRGLLTDLGTFALCCIQLGKELDNSFFSILATVVTVCVLLLWIMVAVLTVYDGLKGEIFYAPCLAKLSDNLPEQPPVAVPNSPNPVSEPGSLSETTK
jgi:hypothetical protein